MEEKEHGKLRTILFWGIPVLLTAIFALFVMNFLGFNVWKSFTDWGNKIPVINDIIPGSAPVQNANSNYQDNWKEKFLNSKLVLNEKDQSIADLNKQLHSLEKTVYDLKTNNDSLKTQIASKNKQDFLNQKKQVSAIYANISPSKAAAMFESMSLEDASLTMSMLDADVESSILGGMQDSKKAAQISMMVKDIMTLNAPDEASLKKQVHALAQKQKNPMQSLSETIAGMPPAEGAVIIQSMMGTNSQVAMNVLKTIDTNNRSQILTVIANKNASLAAQITANLNQ